MGEIAGMNLRLRLIGEILGHERNDQLGEQRR
jgi:hypothetical protein